MAESNINYFCHLCNAYSRIDDDSAMFVVVRDESGSVVTLASGDLGQSVPDWPMCCVNHRNLSGDSDCAGPLSVCGAYRGQTPPREVYEAINSILYHFLCHQLDALLHRRPRRLKMNKYSKHCLIYSEMDSSLIILFN